MPCNGARTGRALHPNGPRSPRPPAMRTRRQLQPARAAGTHTLAVPPPCCRAQVASDMLHLLCLPKAQLDSLLGWDAGLKTTDQVRAHWGAGQVQPSCRSSRAAGPPEGVHGCWLHHAAQHLSACRAPLCSRRRRRWWPR